MTLPEHEAEDACPHCSPQHGDPNTCSWGVWVSSERDGDGQPLRLSVAKSDGAHVAESDAEWLREILRAHDARCGEILTPRIVCQLGKHDATIAHVTVTFGGARVEWESE